MIESIQGTCLSMCPEKERWMREKKGLLHRFEIDESTKGRKQPKADPAKTVKCFSRPAAGLIMTDTSQLRPAPVLLSTIRYLLTKIVTRTDVDWTIIYDFVFDRLRSVRQDIVIQRINGCTSIQLFEPIVRFLAYSAQRLCDRNISEFNEKINNQHLSECIMGLLVMYDESTEKSSLNLEDGIEKLGLNNDRQQMEALYILLNMGNGEALRRALRLPHDFRCSPDVQLSMKISFAWYLRNYARVCSLVRQLPPILVCAAMINIRKIRRVALKIMSSAYNSKVFTFPGLQLQELLLYKDIDKVRADCHLFGLVFTEQNVLFEKGNFKDEVHLVRQMPARTFVFESNSKYLLLHFRQIPRCITLVRLYTISSHVFFSDLYKAIATAFRKYDTYTYYVFDAIKSKCSSSNKFIALYLLPIVF